MTPKSTTQPGPADRIDWARASKVQKRAIELLQERKGEEGDVWGECLRQADREVPR